jgi:hypothetical protein
MFEFGAIIILNKPLTHDGSVVARFIGENGYWTDPNEPAYLVEVVNRHHDHGVLEAIRMSDVKGCVE